MTALGLKLRTERFRSSRPRANASTAEVSSSGVRRSVSPRGGISLSQAKGPRWNRGVREDTSVRIALPPLRSGVTHQFDGDGRIAPPCRSGQTGTVEGRLGSPSQVRILVAACWLLSRQTMPRVPCRRTQVVNRKRFRTAGVGPSEVRILAATFLSVVERSRHLPVEEETHVRVVPGRLRDGGRAWYSRSCRVFTGDPVRR